MVQAVDNWCCVSGTIDEITQEAGQTKAKSDQVELSIKIGKIKPVKGYPALVRLEDAATISVTVRRSQLGDAKAAGQSVTIPVRVAGPGRFFAHPDWSLSRGSPMCGAN